MVVWGSSAEVDGWSRLRLLVGAVGFLEGSRLRVGRHDLGTVLLGGAVMVPE